MDLPWKVISAFVAVFIAGAVFGGVFTLGSSVRRSTEQAASPPAQPLNPLPASTQPRPKVAGPAAPGAMNLARGNAIQPQLMRRFTQQLDLTPEQKKAIEPIVARASDDFQRLRRENLADTARVTDRMYSDVFAMLTADQREELERMRKETLERVQREKQRQAETAAAAAPPAR